MRRVIFLAVSLLLFALLYVNSFGFSIDDYNDVDSCLPQYENALRYIVEEKGVMGGTSATTFSPNAVLKRCDILVAFCRVFEVDVEVYEGYAIPFTDVPESAYYRNHVAWAYDNDIIGGTSHTTFSPNNAVNRQTACLILDRFVTNLNITLPDNGSIAVFDDDDEIGNIYKASVYKMYRAGIMLGDHLNNVNPTDNLQRVHFAVMLFRYYDPAVPVNTTDPIIQQLKGSTFVVKWTAVPDVDGYQIRIVDGESQDIDEPETSYRRRFSNLTENENYTVQVRTYLKYENTSLYSDIITLSVTTPIYYETINNFFDSGYVVRYYGGDTNTNRLNAKNDIDDCMEVVVNRFEALFPVEIMSNSATHLVSSIDDCKQTVTSSNLDNLCAHVNPHTVCYNEFVYSLNPNPNVLYGFMCEEFSETLGTEVFWCGHRVQRKTSIPNEYNRSSYYDGFVFILGEDADEATGVLMHEIAHDFGAPDHYHECKVEGRMDTCNNIKSNGGSGYCSNSTCNSVNGTLPRPCTCLMNVSDQDISSVNILCGGCKSDILNDFRGIEG